MRRREFILFLGGATAAWPLAVRAQQRIMGGNGAVGANHPMAAQAGIDILRAGGNAIDASVAVALALGVCEPMMSGLGGDGFYHVFMAGKGEAAVFNGTGPAPKAATPERYRGGIPIDGPLSVSVPGGLAAVALMQERHGRLPCAQLVEPAIRYVLAGLRRSTGGGPWRQ